MMTRCNTWEFRSLKRYSTIFSGCVGRAGTRIDLGGQRGASGCRYRQDQSDDDAVQLLTITRRYFEQLSQIEDDEIGK